LGFRDVCIRFDVSPQVFDSFFKAESLIAKQNHGRTNEWSRLGSTFMYVRSGMWQLAHCASDEPTGWWLWLGPSNRPLGFRFTKRSGFVSVWHCVHSALPSAFKLASCGRWQSRHVTPALAILLCWNEPALGHRRRRSRTGSTDGRPRAFA
jgi:hypothetical protein